MFNNDKKVTIEWIVEENQKSSEKKSFSKLTNPIEKDLTQNDKLSLMISKIIHEELPQLRENSLLFNLVLEKMKTVQSVENVLSYIRGNNVKEVRDVSFKNGEVLIKCSI